MGIKETAGEKHAGEAMDMFVKLFALEQSLVDGAEKTNVLKPPMSSQSQAAADSVPVHVPAGVAAATP
ncbi:hypothetical protein D3C84_1306700 [compost metagenome]